MIDEHKIIGMLQAKALSCIDAEENKELQEFIDAGHVFPWDELGSYQNVASLLPLALQLELPDAELKDRVALKLIKLSEQLRINKILEEDKFEVEEELDESVNEFTNIPETYIEPPIEIETEATVVEENLSEALNPEESNLNLDEVVLPDLDGGEVSDINLQDDISIESPFETLIDETEIDYPKVEEAEIDGVLAEPEISRMDISEHLVKDESENTSPLHNQQSIEIKQIEDSEEESDQKPDLTKKSVVEKVFKTLEQDFDTLKNNVDESERKTTRGLLIAYIIVAVLLALLIFSFFKFSSDINSLKDEVKELKNKISSSLYEEQKINSEHHSFS
ncbi:MAG: hypothetical protein IH619_02035 [Ignavibacterium sp.]|nr:hypothetical protein [Ignavibacterium sp.]